MWNRTRKSIGKVLEGGKGREWCCNYITISIFFWKLWPNTKSPMGVEHWSVNSFDLSIPYKGLHFKYSHNKGCGFSMQICWKFTIYLILYKIMFVGWEHLFSNPCTIIIHRKTRREGLFKWIVSRLSAQQLNWNLPGRAKVLWIL